MNKSLSDYLQQQLTSRYRQKIWRRGGYFLVGMLLGVGKVKLLLVTGVAVAAMFAVYHFEEWDWQGYWLKYRQWLFDSHAKLTCAVASGGLSAIATYLVASVWTDIENKWLATGLVLQGLISTVTLALLGWQFYHRHRQESQSNFDRLLQNIASPSSLTRLVTVRELAKLWHESQLTDTQKRELQDYFQLMLKIEPEPIIREFLINTAALALGTRERWSKAQYYSPKGKRLLVKEKAEYVMQNAE